MLQLILETLLVAMLYAIPVVAAAFLVLGAVFHVVKVFARAYGPVVIARFDGVADASAFAGESDERRAREAIRDLRSAELHLHGARGALIIARPIWRSRSFLELRAKLAMGRGSRDALLLDASEDMTVARVALARAAARRPDLDLEVTDLDLDLVDPLEQVRRRSPTVWLLLNLFGGPVRAAAVFWIGARRTVRALRAVNQALGAAELAHRRMVERHGSDADIRARAFSSAPPEVRRFRAARDLSHAELHLLAADGLLDAARRINARLFISNFDRQLHDTNVLSASAELLRAVQAVEVAGAREPGLALDARPLDVDITDPIQRRWYLRIPFRALPRTVQGLIYSIVMSKRLRAAVAAVRDMQDQLARRRPVLAQQREPAIAA